MSKGTPSMGKKNKITHIRCRRCGRHSYHIRTSKCSACGFGKTKKLYGQSWKWKIISRKRRKYIMPKHQKQKTHGRGRSPKA